MTKILQTTGRVTYEKVLSEVHPELADEMAKVLQEEIDWEIMCELMSSIGWVQVEIDRPSTEELTEWCHKNLKGKFRGRNHTWMFERAEDATWFTMRWSS